jgi:hypothetical protein
LLLRYLWFHEHDVTSVIMWAIWTIAM